MRAEKLLTPEEARMVIDKNMSEKAFLAMVREYARAMGWLTYHTLHSKGSEPGMPDLIMARSKAVKNGRIARLIFAELKRDGQLLTNAQREWIDLLDDVRHECKYGYLHNVEVYMWHPSDWDTIVKILAR